MVQIYKKQNDYYNKNIIEKEDYVSIINFAKIRRVKLYQQMNIRLDTVSEFKILEGYSPAWGTFRGIVWSKYFAYSYEELSGKNSLKFERIDTKDISQAISGVNPTIVDLVKNWDISEIKKRKAMIGNQVNDGSYFLATEIKSDKRRLQVECIHFPEFP